MGSEDYIENLKVCFCDIRKDVTYLLKALFNRFDRVRVLNGDIFNLEADAIATPGNSAGTMDGGFDYIVNTRFGNIQSKIQEMIQERGTPLPIGVAVVVPTKHPNFHYLIYSPTVRVPGDKLKSGEEVYNAMVAILRGVIKHNEQYETSRVKQIKSLAMPCLGTGQAGLDPVVAGINIFKAYQDTLEQRVFKSSDEVWTFEKERNDELEILTKSIKKEFESLGEGSNALSEAQQFHEG